jgi:2Fe-2S ferredoxin
MTTITFIHPDSSAQSVDAEDGDSLMRAALTHGVDGIVAECGGNAVCATCHVYVDEGWLGKLEPLGEDEDALLDGTADERLPNSRLSCQINISPALEGLVVRLPARQS